MADHKYANLPGIAAGEPDIFETSSLPDDDKPSANQDESDAVEILHTNTRDLFRTFRDKPFSADTDYSSASLTPSEKLDRLRRELDVLQSELAASPTPGLATLVSQLDSVSQQMASLQLKRLLDGAATLPLPTPRTQAAVELVAPTKETELAASLEARVARLERFIGDVSCLSSSTLSSNIDGLRRRLSLLDTDAVNGCISRLQLLLNRLSAAKQQQADVDRLDRLEKLVITVEGVKPLLELVPVVVERMRALAKLHEQALQFSAALAAVDTDQQEIRQRLDKYGQLLGQMEGTVRKNWEVVQKNLDKVTKS